MEYFDLGTYSREVTTTSPDARTWFNRGLIWTHAYNHEEAIVCFRKALEIDPGCAMAHWGIANAIGPNYNKWWEHFQEDEKPEALALAQAELDKAFTMLDKAAPVERALIEALRVRYPAAPVEDFTPWHDAYADAMRTVHREFPGDLDVASIFAEALMNRTPWKLWDLPNGKPSEGTSTVEAIGVLENAFETIEGAWDHPGLLHMYIHLQEMSPHPERALRQGDRLFDLCPDAGHLIHMGTHIDVLCGDYESVVSRNRKAIVADRKFYRKEGPENFYTVYRCHNYHFVVFGAMFLGQPKPAFEAADELISTLPAEILRPLADWLESFISIKQHILVRFGMWQQILDQPLPEDAELYCMTTAVMRYARTVALANLGQLDAAEKERDLFFEAQANVPDSRMLFKNDCPSMLRVGQQMMLGELEYHRGNHEIAFDHLRKGVYLSDNLNYDEPWGWMQPVRHALGALLIEQGRYKEAEKVYREDLGLDDTLSRACQHPANVWALHGLHECLKQRGEKIEALHVKHQLDKAMARSDVKIAASCYCRHVPHQHP